MAHYDTIILGLGGMGSAALWHLARRGRKVLGIEQFDIAHDRGSSHGGSRLIRRAYFEHPDYVPLVSRAYELWNELEESAKTRLFHRTGLLLAGRRPGALIDGVLLAAKTHRLSIDDVSHEEAARRFPGLAATPDQSLLYEEDAGFLEVENCVRAHIEQAAAYGAQLRLNTKVEHWSACAQSVQVQAGNEVHSAESLIICAGSWSASVLREVYAPLTIRRKVVVWYRTNSPGYRVSGGCPVFCFDTTSGFFYGFPSFEGDCVKVGEHSGGQPVQSPESLNRNVSKADFRPIEEFMRIHLPLARREVVRESVCMYTMTPDEHFIIDRHPGHSNVFLACGFSGHGFKFASIIGSTLADLAITGNTGEPVDFLRLSRFHK